MIKEFKNLNQGEVELLLKAPALVSVMAASTDEEIDEKERTRALKISDMRTFTTRGALNAYYKEVEKVFEKNFDQLDKQLPKDFQERRIYIRNKLRELDVIVDKLDDKFARALKHSLETYKDHVSKAHQNALEFFILPFNFKGLTA